MNLQVQFESVPAVNFSMQQNHVPVIREIRIKNEEEIELTGLCVRITSDPEFFEPFQMHLDALSPGEEKQWTVIPLRVSTSYLSNLTEQILGAVRIEISKEDQVLFSTSHEISLLAFDQWGGISILPEMLAAFVTPNSPVIAPIIKRASEILENWTGSSAMDEYQTRDPNRVKKQMAAIYEAIAEQQIAYCTVPASYQESGQRIRLCDDILQHKLATCLDMALLYAGCLEAVGIHPLIVLIKGHAFAGGWLIPDTFPDSVNDDVALLTKRAAEGINEILLVETTCMNAGANISFDAASGVANDKLKDTDSFLLFIDVLRARNARILPLPLRIVRDGKFEICEPQDAPRRQTEAPVSLSATDIVSDQGKVSVGKQTIWERKLLDLSLRNNLLNTRITKNTLQLISVKLAELEDALADGEEFQILEKPQDWDNPWMSAGIYQALHASDPVVDLVKSELKQRRLHAYLNQETLQRSLTYLYRSSRLSLEENGANTLYLALGLLKWLETPSSTRPRFAPILLLPIEIIRKSAAKGYVIRSRDEETMLNITLLEMLRQYFGIQIGGLDPLPRDESGVDVPRIFNTIRRAIMSQKGWDVEEQAIVGNFSFSKFILWNDIHNNADKLCRNKIVASLMSGRLEWTPEPFEEENVDLDRKYPAEEIALPIGADSSQFEAICAAVEQRSFILHGPPGTGKSQTITNIIANALYKGKKVLFVAEKMAALQVVQRRLESIGLAPFCLELHSNKAKKSAVLQQLKRTTEVVKQKSNQEFRIEAEQINLLRGQLNDYMQALHRVHPAGLSLYDCFARYASLDYSGETIAFSPGTLQGMTPEGRARVDAAVEEYQAACILCGHPATDPWKGVGLTEYTPSLKSELRDELETLSNHLEQIKGLRARLAEILPIEVSGLSASQDQALREVVRILSSAQVLSAGLLAENDPAEMSLLLDRAARCGEERDRVRDAILSRFDPGIFSADVSAWERQWRQSSSKWWLPRLLGRNKLRGEVRAYAKGSEKLDPEQLLEVFSLLKSYRTLQEQLDEYGKTLSPILGRLWDEQTGSWDRLSLLGQTNESLHRAILALTEDIPRSLSVKQALRNRLNGGTEAFKTLYGALFEQYLSLETDLSERTMRLQQRLHTSAFTDVSTCRIQAWSSLVEGWVEHLGHLHEWVMYNLQREKVLSLDLETLVQALENGKVDSSQVVLCYKKSFLKAYAEYILSQEPRLMTFHGKLFEEKLRRFRTLSRDFERLTRQELFARLAGSLPALQKEAAQSSEVGILQRNIRNGGRGTSIRRLFDQIPDLLSRMCPCMLMSPISVAQYIDADRSPFDLVIFDEASQMPTSEAVGAIARGRHLIVVGDPKQMPPTHFFSTDTYDEENADKEDLESILDDCLALSLPSKHLLWHYRSKHESLIAFSNVKYYENRLLTFPSPDDLATKVHFQYVDGLYDRGATRQNLAEAQAVVKEIEQRLSDPLTARRSIGVVTFNTHQQSLIEDLLTDRFRIHPELETAALECEEPVFIKNLENVQGDERDVILFSVGYGPDKTGRIALNFGPLNREGGWRRLNVAVSRARYQMKVFSSLRADQIDLNRTSAEGVAGLKAFLEYAEKGRKVLFSGQGSENRTQDALLASIARELEARGYVVRLDVGCSGYRIDIGVVDPQHPDKYLLGILCDGYHASVARTAHDRVVTQPGALRMLGWKLHHLWAMDWWEDRERALGEVVAAIESARHSAEDGQAEQPSSSAAVPAPVEHTALSFSAQEDAVPSEPDVPARQQPYQETLLEKTPVASNDFVQGLYDARILEKIRAVVRTEAPISRALLCKRVLNSFSIARMGLRLSAHMERLLAQSGFPVTGGENPFYWNTDQDPEHYQVYRPVSFREALDIAPQEVAAAVCQVLEEQGALPRQDLLREVAHIFHYTRLGDNVTASLSRGLEEALRRGWVEQDEDKVRLKPV